MGHFVHKKECNRYFGISIIFCTKHFLSKPGTMCSADYASPTYVCQGFEKMHIMCHVHHITRCVIFATWIVFFLFCHVVYTILDVRVTFLCNSWAAVHDSKDYSLIYSTIFLSHNSLACFCCKSNVKLSFYKKRTFC